MGVGVLLLVDVALGWYLGHLPSRGERVFYGWVAAMVVAVSCLVARPLCGARRYDDFVGRLVDSLFNTR